MITTVLLGVVILVHVWQTVCQWKVIHDANKFGCVDHRVHGQMYWTLSDQRFSELAELARLGRLYQYHEDREQVIPESRVIITEKGML